MTIHVPNPEVLKAGIEHAELHLDQWHQGTWVAEGLTYKDETCGTTACLAGHILLAQGMSWRELRSGGSIAERALLALGFPNDPLYDGDALYFHNLIFGHVSDAEGFVGIDPDKMKDFKAHITELTGVEL